MADVKNVISLGIGASPGDIHFFLLVGLDTRPVVAESIGPQLEATWRILPVIRSAATIEARSPEAAKVITLPQIQGSEEI